MTAGERLGWFGNGASGSLLSALTDDSAKNPTINPATDLVTPNLHHPSRRYGHNAQFAHPVHPALQQAVSSD